MLDLGFAPLVGCFLSDLSGRSLQISVNGPALLFLTAAWGSTLRLSHSGLTLLLLMDTYIISSVSQFQTLAWGSFDRGGAIEIEF